MKTLGRLLLALATLILPLQAEDALKFVCWNIEWFPGLRPTASAEEADAHMKACQEALREMDPDIFVAQEIRDWAAFHELVSAVPGLTVHVVSSFRDPESGQLRPQQVAVASKLKCVEAHWIAWEANYPNISRGFSYAALEHPGGGLLMVYSNHLKSNAGSERPGGEENVAAMRAEQARQLIAHRAELETAFQKHEIAGWLVAGDFNSNHDGQFPLCSVVEKMTAGGYFNTWSGVPREQRLTWRSDPDPEKRRFEPTTFDYVFTRGLKAKTAFIIDVPRELSDHSPIGLAVEKP
jgi:endonuclease/exonuclease/phosphatase family metal-dependent hydrolase